MDKIFLHGMKAQTIIGVYEWERQQKQTVLLDLEISLPERDVNSDEVATTVNYAEVCQAIRTSLSECEFQLLERLAEHIAQLVLTDFQAAAVKIRVIKQGILPDVNAVGIEVERFRQPEHE